MGAKCENCGKGVQYGHNVSHAKNRTRKLFKANLHKTKVWVDGSYKKMKLCVKCLRRFKKEDPNKKIAEMPIPQIANL